MNQATLSDRQPVLSGSRILVVDKSSLIRSLMAELLRSHGYTVDLAGSAREALQLAQIGQWDAVVLDIGLPDMQGVELYTRMRQGSGRECLPVIFVSGHPEQKLLHALSHVPWAVFLPKPFGVLQFLCSLERCLRSGQKHG
jgi:CheY-like chemotaxis protein